MSTSKYKVWGIALLLGANLVVISKAEIPDPILSTVLAAVQKLKANPIDEPQDETSLAWDYALSKHDTATAAAGVVSLWKKHKRALVELVWWRQKDGEVRRSILLLFYSLSKVEADNFPNFEEYAKRFEPMEAAARKKEIDDVKAVVQRSAAILVRAFPQ